MRQASPAVLMTALLGSLVTFRAENPTARDTQNIRSGSGGGGRLGKNSVAKARAVRAKGRVK